MSIHVRIRQSYAAEYRELMASLERDRKAFRKAYSNADEPWKPAEDRKLLRLRRAGKDLEYCAEAHGRTTNAIEGRLRVLHAVLTHQALGGL